MLVRLLEEARAIHAEDQQMCRAIGRFGAELLASGSSVLTHCNAGGLATAEYGTALAAIFTAQDQGKMLHVFVDETRPLLRVLSVPREKLMPIIFTLCTIGSFAIAGRTFDIQVMLFFGVVGFALREMNYPMAPLVLGIVLGPLLDSSFRRGMVLFDGNFLGFFADPISLVLALGCGAMVLTSIPPIRRGLGELTRRLVGRRTG